MVERSDTGSSALQLDNGAGPALPLSPAAFDGQVAAVLARLSSEVQGRSPPRPAGHRARRTVWLLGGGLFAGSAAAMVATQAGWFAEPQARPAVGLPSPQPVRPPAPPAPEAPEAPEAPVVGEVPASPQAPPAATPPAPAHRRPVKAPSDLLARANRLRGQGRYRAAVRGYLAAMSADPRGASGHVAAVAAAAIRLEHLGDPRGAIALYRRALRAQPEGALSLESHEGIARAYRMLGDAAAEVQALSALLDTGQPGPARERARERLAELRKGGQTRPARP